VVGAIPPAKTLRDIISRLNTEITAILAPLDIPQRLAAQGADVRSKSPDAFGKFMRVESKRLRKVIKAAKITLE
jgi:tripartite-type tricarboxylate transporter receptor subunit TctC